MGRRGWLKLGLKLSHDLFRPCLGINLVQPIDLDASRREGHQKRTSRSGSYAEEVAAR
jgi:hypothetical protein